MGCRFAGAQDLQAYWEMITEGRDGFGPVPADRWDAEAFFDANPRATDKSYAPAGGFIDDVRSFPAIALQIPPRRVEVMDPQQRLGLEICLAAVEDAGYDAGSIPTQTGVYMGVTAMEYRTLISSRLTAQMMATGAFGEAPEDPATLANIANRVLPSRPFTAPGGLSNMIAATVAQELRIKGPAYTVDAACASALVALADAVAALRTGQVDCALAGGVYICLTPEHHVAFSRVGAMSRTGQCLPFDSRADGFVEGDGCGVIMLKRVEDAVAAGDRIYGVIAGVGMNNDGGGEGPMAPVKSGQIDVIERAWRDAGIPRAALGYVEAHGTGTSVGDKIEFEGLLSAFGDEATQVTLGSSKANVGHTMSAAGMAGVIRATLAMHHRTRPPMANFEAPKEDLGLAESPFEILTEAKEWTADQRVSAVSSFGFGGTNVHIVLASDTAPVTPVEQAELVLMSADDDATLRDLARRTAKALEADSTATVAGVSRAWAVRRMQGARVGLVAATIPELCEKLTAFADGELPQGVTYGEAGRQAPKLAFLYPGQGAQRVGMLSDIRDRFPVVAEALSAMDAAVTEAMARPITHLLYPERRAEAIGDDDAMTELTATENCQPALISVGVALTQLLDQVGVTADVVAGHSVGEFTAAIAGGVLSPADGVRFVAARGAAMAAMQGDTGAMVALVCDVETARSLLVEGTVLANINHPRQVVISGESEAVARVAAAADAKEIKAVPLAVSHGFHSPVFESLDLSAVIGALPLSNPTVPVSSGIFDHPYRDAEEAREVFQAHATSPVVFTTALERCAELGAELYLQVGAGGPLRSFARGTLGNTTPVYSLASKEDHDGGASLLTSLAELWVRGVALDISPITGDAPLASVPSSVLPREVYWAVRDHAGAALKLSGASASAVAATQTAAAPEEATAPTTGLTVAETVMQAVSRTSAYPRAALRAEMTLGDDLGFDSMMVADLIEDITKAVDGLEGIPQELLINSPTIQDLIDFAENPVAIADSADDDAPLNRYEGAWVPAALLPSDQAEGSRGTALLAGTESRWTAPLVAALEAEGYAISRDPSTQASLILWQQDVSAPVPVSAVLAGEAEMPDTSGDFIAVLDAQAAHGHTPDVLLLAREDDLWAAGPAGALRAVAKDWTDATIKALHVDPTMGASSLAQAALAELGSPDQTTDVRLSPEGRFVRGMTLIAPTALEQPRWEPDAADTVLVTGGTRGIGLKLARRIATSGAKVLLLGRSAPSDEATVFIGASRGQVQAVRADVTDRATITEALKGHAVTAVIHAAGLLADGPLGDVPAERGHMARMVKAKGFLNVISAAGSGLEVALGIGSWAGRFGNRHQCHYGAGNAQLASLAKAMPDRLRAVVPEFGPWSSSEMVATIPPAVQNAMRSAGIDFVGDAAGLGALLDDLYEGRGSFVRGRRVQTTSRLATTEETLSVDTHPYLLDHAVAGKPVLPLAGATDLMAELAAVPIPFEVRDLTLFQGISVTSPLAVQCSVNGDTVELRQGEKGTLSYRATIRPLTEEIVVPTLDESGAEPTLPLGTFYQDVTFHGPMLQGIASIDGVGEHFVRGTLNVGQPSTWIPGTPRDAWTVDPLVFDSAMQLCAYVAWTRFGRAGTPVGFERYLQLRPMPKAGTVTAEVTFGDADGDHFSANLAIRDSEGALIARVEEVSAQLVEVEVDGAGDGMEDFEVKAEWVDPAEWPGYKDLAMRLKGAEMMGLENPYFDVHQGTARNTSLIDGREVINFSSYNYLGLSGDARIREDVSEAMATYGTSVSASRIASGQRPFHVALEQGLAKALGVDDAIAFPSGHATNVTTIGHLFGPNDLIIHDELIHDSCLQGIKLSGAARRGFKHDDADDLVSQLRELRPHYEKVLILIEGVYSMDGDIADLPAFVDIKERFGCMLMVDEAHSFGTIGETGCGIREHFGIDARRVDIWMGTMSKSLASMGGWIAGRKELIEYMRYTTPGFVFAAGMTPTLGQAALSALGLMHEEPWRVQQLQDRSKFFYEALKSRGVDTGDALGESPVIPAITGDSMQAMMLSQRLLERGINAKPIVFPAVAEDAARLRLFMCALHTEEELEYAAETIATELAVVRSELTQ